MAANVTYIPPKAANLEALRVAAYCRVSSDSSDQLHSYATQIKAYTEQIGAHTDWELVDVYADEGLTGTRMDKREDFQRLLADCRKGKVDRVQIHLPLRPKHQGLSRSPERAVRPGCDRLL